MSTRSLLSDINNKCRRWGSVYNACTEKEGRSQYKDNTTKREQFLEMSLVKQ